MWGLGIMQSSADEAGPSTKKRKKEKGDEDEVRSLSSCSRHTRESSFVQTYESTCSSLTVHCCSITCAVCQAIMSCGASSCSCP